MCEKKISYLRKAFQGLFLLLVLMGLHRETAPFLALMLPLAFVAGNFFCGWLCPLGALQEVLGKLGARLTGKKYRLPERFRQPAQYTKYLLALTLLGAIGLGLMKTEAVKSLFFDAYHSFFAVFEGSLPAASAVVFLVLVLAVALFVDRPYCNYLCLNSIEYAVPSWTRLFTVVRNPDSCIQCGACDRKCPMLIRVSETRELRNLQCINCFECVAACPVSGTLTYGRAKRLTEKLKNGLKSLRGGNFPN